jgi:hypothetical protein
MTQAARYKITLRITHPTLEAGRIGHELGLAPVFAYTAGDRRVTPKGTELPGTRKESYWYYVIGPTDEPIERTIARVTASLAEKKSFLRQISETGGRTEYFIGWFSSENSGFVFEHHLLGELSEMRIDLSFDIYPEVGKQSTS